MRPYDCSTSFDAPPTDGTLGLAHAEVIQLGHRRFRRIQPMQLRRDHNVYRKCFAIPCMDHCTAMKITFLKTAINEFLPWIPRNMRNCVYSLIFQFDDYIIEAAENRHNPTWLLERVVSIFDNVVKVVANQPNCLHVMRRIYAMANQLFG